MGCSGSTGRARRPRRRVLSTRRPILRKWPAGHRPRAEFGPGIADRGVGAPRAGRSPGLDRTPGRSARAPLSPRGTLTIYGSRRGPARASVDPQASRGRIRSAGSVHRGAAARDLEERGPVRYKPASVLIPDRLTAGQQILTLLIVVRIHVGDPSPLPSQFQQLDGESPSLHFVGRVPIDGHPTAPATRSSRDGCPCSRHEERKSRDSRATRRRGAPMAAQESRRSPNRRALPQWPSTIDQRAGERTGRTPPSSRGVKFLRCPCLSARR